MLNALTLAVVLSFSSVAAKQVPLPQAGDDLFNVVPGDNQLTSCEQNCLPSFDSDESGVVADDFEPYRDITLWHCEVVTKEQYDTGDYPGGTICRPL
jgi:hypothetical protein